MFGPNALGHRAVTPVVGVVIMVVITVLLAGTAGAFFFGITDQPAEADRPTAVFEFEDDLDSGSDTVRIAHVSGEAVSAENLYVVIEGARCTAGGSPDGRYGVADDFDFPAAEMRAGMSTQVGAELGPSGTAICAGASNDLTLSDATVTLVWENSDGDEGTFTSWSR
jgi:flagellin-like protein